MKRNLLEILLWSEEGSILTKRVTYLIMFMVLYKNVNKFSTLIISMNFFQGKNKQKFTILFFLILNCIIQC